MRTKFIIFGHEIRIRPEYEVRMHITQFPENECFGEIEQWKHNFPIDKRVNVYIQYRGFIEFVFSRYDSAILNFGETALFHLETILSSFRKIRDKFELRGATPEQLKIFDEKIYNCFNRTIRIAEDKIEELEEIESKDLKYHLEVVNRLKSFKLEEYYK